MQIRLPRVILSLLVGASLGGAGTVFQSLFVNPMADAYIIGISSGSALGAVLAIAFRLRYYILGVSSIPIFAFIGGVSTVLLVYSISSRGRHNQMLNLLLSGLAINSFLSSIMSFLLLLSDTSLHESILAYGWIFWKRLGTCKDYVSIFCYFYYGAISFY